MAADRGKSKFYRSLSIVFFTAVSLLATAVSAQTTRDIKPVMGEKFYLLADRNFSSDENALIRLEAKSSSSYGKKANGVDITLYRVKDPIAFLKKQSNLHRPHIDGHYNQGQNRQNVISYLRDNWYKKSRQKWQAVFSGRSRASALKYLPEVKQPSDRSFQPDYSKDPAYKPIAGFDLVDRFRYPLWQAKPYDASKVANLPGSSSNFVKPRRGNILVPLGKLKPGLYFVEAAIGAHRASTMVAVSDSLGVTKLSKNQLMVWTVQKKTGEPAAGVTLSATDGRGVIKSGKSNADGIWKITQPNPQKLYVIGQDQTGGVFLSENFYYNSEVYNTKFYAFTDRPLYQPGERVYVKILGRDFISARKSADIKKGKARIRVNDPSDTPLIVRNVQIAAGVKGGESSFILPKFAASGGYTLLIDYQGKTYSSAFRVVRYAKPHFEMDIHFNRQKYETGQDVLAEVRLNYPNGRPVSDANVTWSLRSQQVSMVEGEVRFLGRFPKEVKTGTGKTNSKGVLALNLPSADKPSRYTLRVAADDASSYQVAGTEERIIGLSAKPMRLLAKKRLSKEGEKVSFTLSSVGKKPVKDGKTYRWEAIRLEDRSSSDGKLEDGTLEITFEKGGAYSISALDEKGAVIARASHWVQGDDLKVIPGSIVIQWDKEKYQIGDQAKGVINFAEEIKEALLTLERDGVERSCLLSKGCDWVKASSQDQKQWHIQLKVEEEYSPNVTLSVSYVKNGDFVFQNKGLRVDIPSIQVAMTPSKETYKPGEMAEVTLKTTLKGKGKSVYLTLSVVDEMIYVLQPEIAPNMVEFFYHVRRNQVRTSSSQSFYAYDSASLPASLTGRSHNSYYYRNLKVKERPRREDVVTAYWQPSLQTNAKGEATIRFRVPDSLTRWRITARAIADDGAVGQSKAFLLADKDVYLKWSGPTHFRQGDRPKARLIALNNREENITATFNAKGLGGDTSGSIDLKPGSNSITLDLKITDSNSLVTGLKRGSESLDLLETEILALPKQWLSERSVAFPLEQKENQITLPEKGFDYRLRIYANPAEQFFAVADSLIEYPYGCVEQTSSRLIPTVMAYEVIKAKDPAAPRLQELEKMIQDGRNRLWALSGGRYNFSWWGEGENYSPFMTAYAMAALNRSGRALGLENQVNWSHLFDIYRHNSEGKTILEKALVLHLAGQQGLSIKTLVRGLVKEVENIELKTLQGNSDFSRSSVFYAGELNQLMGIAVVRNLAQSQNISASAKLKALAASADQALSGQKHALAKAIYWVGQKQKNSKFQAPEEELKLLLKNLATKYPTVDRSLTLTFLEELLQIQQINPHKLSLANARTWKKGFSKSGRSFWQLAKGNKSGSKVAVNLSEAPAKALQAELFYQSYQKEKHELPVKIQRKLYKLTKSSEGFGFEMAEVTGAWQVSPRDLLLDEVTITAEQNHPYGLLEISLPSGAMVEDNLYGIRVRKTATEEFTSIGKGNHQLGDLHYAIPFEELEGTQVIRSLVRFGQSGTFELPASRFYEMYSPTKKAYEDGQNHPRSLVVD